MTGLESISRLAAAGLVAVLAAGCSLIPARPSPTPSLFLLRPDFSSEAPPAPSSPLPTIAIAPPTAQPGFDGPRMAYVSRPFELRYFARHRWVEAPARMLEPLLERALERAGRLRPIASGRGGVAALRLETEIVVLQQEFDVRPSRLRFRLRARLIDAAAGGVLATTELEALEPAQSEDPYGGVVAANRAVARVLEALAAWCDAQGATGPAAGRSRPAQPSRSG